MLTEPNRLWASSPAFPLIQAAAAAPSSGSGATASTAARMPLSTSPLPAVAMPAQPASVIRVFAPSVTTVAGPFKSTTVPVSFAYASAVPTGSARISSTVRPVSRENSFTWGVRMSLQAAPRICSLSIRLSRVSPSASTIRRPEKCPSSHARACPAPSPVPMPMPKAAVRVFPVSSANSFSLNTIPSPSSLSGNTVLSSTAGATTGHRRSGTASFTTPAPERMAAFAMPARRIAPLYRLLPPISAV